MPLSRAQQRVPRIVLTIHLAEGGASRLIASHVREGDALMAERRRARPQRRRTSPQNRGGRVCAEARGRRWMGRYEAGRE